MSTLVNRAHHRPALRPVQWGGWAVLLLALILYLFTLDTGLQPEELRGGDLITHQYAQVQARPSNAPGYPLYTMGGWLWFHGLRIFSGLLGNSQPNPLPLLSSYSTLWALLALALLYRILCWVTISPSQPAGAWRLAALLTLFYGVTYFFWYYATTTEQYSSAIAQTLAIFYLYLRWQRAEAAVAANLHGAAPRANRLLLILALLCGVALAHMLTVAFIVPSLVAVILWQAPRLLRSPRLIALAVVAAFLPLLSYSYVYWRGAAHPEWWGQGDWSSPMAWFWSFVSTAQGRAELGWGFADWCTPLANGFPALIVQELSWPVLLFGLIGIAWLGRRRALLCYGTLLIYVAFCWAYRCGNWFQVILPAYPLVIIGVGALLKGIVSKAIAHGGRLRWLTGLQWGIELLLLIAIVGRVVTLWPATDSRNRRGDSALDQAALLLARPLPAQQALFAAVDEALALQYLINIWQIQPDLRVVSSTQAADLLTAGASVYSTWTMLPTLRAELPTTLPTTTRAVDPAWFAVVPAGAAAPVAALPATAALADLQLRQPLLPAVTLQRVFVQPTPPSPVAGDRTALATQGIDLYLLWQLTPAGWPADLALSVRLMVQGAPVAGAQIDRPQPTLGLSEPVDGLLWDPYHFAGVDADAVDGLLLILYRVTDGGFENVVEAPFTWR